LVNEEKLAELARVIDLGLYIFVGRGEFRSVGSSKNLILADSFEALLAAIYVDCHHKVEVLEDVFNSIVKNWEDKSGLDFYSLEQIDIFDTKSKLQELTMAAYGLFPKYISIDLPNNAGYRVEAWIGENKIIEMSGVSKKKVEKLLAKKIIDEKLY
jgi:ribonuclease-3